MSDDEPICEACETRLSVAESNGSAVVGCDCQTVTLSEWPVESIWTDGETA